MTRTPKKKNDVEVDFDMTLTSNLTANVLWITITYSFLTYMFTYSRGSRQTRTVNQEKTESKQIVIEWRARKWRLKRTCKSRQILNLQQKSICSACSFSPWVSTFSDAPCWQLLVIMWCLMRTIMKEKTEMLIAGNRYDGQLTNCAWWSCDLEVGFYLLLLTAFWSKKDDYLCIVYLKTITNIFDWTPLSQT